MKILLSYCVILVLSGCFFKFAGTDNLYREGKKSRPSLTIDRIWCSQCGCEAIELKQMEKGQVVYELLFNCTDNCPPGVKSYKIERTFENGLLKKSSFYWLVPEGVGTIPLSNRDTAMINRINNFRQEFFFQRYCAIPITRLKAAMPTDSAKIKRVRD